jgi:hypothetical protein
MIEVKPLLSAYCGVCGAFSPVRGWSVVESSFFGLLWMVCVTSLSRAYSWCVAFAAYTGG